MSDQVEIDNEDIKCPRCGTSTKIGMIFHNTNRHGHTFTYMKIGEFMHAECYIELVIDVYLEKKLKK